MQKFKKSLYCSTIILSVTIFSKPLENSPNLISGKLPNGNNLLYI